MNAQNFGYLRFAFVIVAMLLSLLSCDEGKTPTGEIVIFSIPSDPSPADHATDQNLDLWLFWSEGSQTEAPYYNVYFGTEDGHLELLVVTGGTGYPLRNLQPNTTYFWRVEACDGEGVCRKSPVWTFTTGDTWVYPLRGGAEWRYLRRVAYLNFSVDSLAQYFDGPMTDTIKVTVTTLDTLYDGTEVYVLMEEWENCGQSECYGWSYFRNSSEGLYYYGSERYYNSIVPHKPVVAMAGVDGADGFQPAGSVPAAFLVTQDAASGPQRSLAYPMRVGLEWTVLEPENSDMGWTIAKRISTRNNIYTPAGVFDCYVIRRLWDKDGDGAWDEDISMIDAVAREGLILREAYYYDVPVIVYDAYEPVVAGTCDIIERYRLIEYEL